MVKLIKIVKMSGTLLLILNLVLVASSETNSCRVDLQGCEYKVTFTPNSKCEQSDYMDIITNTNKREKRSTDMSPNSFHHVIFLNENKRTKRSEFTEDSLPITKAEFKRLSQKVSKTVDKLSVRVLRWWRKLGRKMDDIHNKGPKERSLANNNYNCPHRFIGIKDWSSCYLLSNFNASWYDAKEYCGAFDGDLVSMGTVKEHYLLTFLIKNDRELKNAEGWWTSGSYLSNRKQWIWTSQFYNKQFTFIKWGSGEPNEDGSQCMLLKKTDDHKWHDEICTHRFNFICEIQTTGIAPSK